MKRVPLTQGMFALVDEVDYARIMCFKYYAAFNKNTYYARRKKDGVIITMHHDILMEKRGTLIDHINHNGLDNRRSNLRICTISQNAANRRWFKSRFGYRGVLQTNAQKTFGAQIVVNNKNIYLGSYATIEDAARAYDAAAREFFGEFATLNFPDELRPYGQEQPMAKHWQNGA